MNENEEDSTLSRLETRIKALGKIDVNLVNCLKLIGEYLSDYKQNDVDESETYLLKARKLILTENGALYRHQLKLVKQDNKYRTDLISGKK